MTSERDVDVNGITLHVTEDGPADGPPVVLIHGWPETSYSWRHQLRALGAAGYHVLAPDMRGYGRSSCPHPVAEYSIDKLTGDLVGLLDHDGHAQAVFVGHDWGAQVLWDLLRLHPDRASAAAVLSVPFTPRPPMLPTARFKAWAGPRFFYILYFQEQGPAEAEMEADPRGFLRDVLFSISGQAPPGVFHGLSKGARFRDGLATPSELPAWLTEADLDRYAADFAVSGFRGGLNWYRNFDRNWELTESVAEARIEVPTLFVAGDRDTVLDFTPTTHLQEWVPGLVGDVRLPGVGHWTQQEAPEAVNRLLLDFLAGPAGARPV